MLSIHLCPPEAHDRVMRGHWEGDFIKSANNASSVGVLVEHTSRLTRLDASIAAEHVLTHAEQIDSTLKPATREFLLFR
jgi:IS30 family transposase